MGENKHFRKNDNIEISSPSDKRNESSGINTGFRKEYYKVHDTITQDSAVQKNEASDTPQTLQQQLSKLAEKAFVKETQDQPSEVDIRDPLWERFFEDLRKEERDKRKITEVQQAREEFDNATKSFSKARLDLEAANKSYQEERISLKNATPEQIDKIYENTNKSLKNLDIIEARLDMYESAKKSMDKVYKKMNHSENEKYQTDLKKAEEVAKELNESKNTLTKQLEKMKEEITPFKVENMSKEMSNIREDCKKRISSGYLSDENKRILQKELAKEIPDTNTLRFLQTQLQKEIAKIDSDHAQLNITLKPTVDDINDQASSFPKDKSTWQKQTKDWSDMATVSLLSDQLKAQRKEYQEYTQDISKKLEGKTDALSDFEEHAASFANRLESKIKANQIKAKLATVSDLRGHGLQADLQETLEGIDKTLASIHRDAASEFNELSKEMSTIRDTYDKSRKHRISDTKRLRNEISGISGSDTKHREDAINHIKSEIANIDREYAEIDRLKPTLEKVSTVTHSLKDMAQWSAGLSGDVSDKFRFIDIKDEYWDRKAELQSRAARAEAWQDKADMWLRKLSNRREQYQDLLNDLGDQKPLSNAEVPKEVAEFSDLRNKLNKVAKDSIEKRDTSFLKIHEKVQKLNSKYIEYEKNGDFPTAKKLEEDHTEIEKTRSEVKKELVKIQDNYAEINLSLRPMIDNEQTGDQSSLRQLADQKSSALNEQRESYERLAKDLEEHSRNIEKTARKLEVKIIKDYNDRYDYTLGVNQWISHIEDSLKYSTQNLLENVMKSIQEVSFELEDDRADIARDTRDASINSGTVSKLSEKLGQQERHYQKMQIKVETFEKEVQREIGSRKRESIYEDNRRAFKTIVDDYNNAIQSGKDPEYLLSKVEEQYNQFWPHINEIYTEAQNYRTQTGREDWPNRLDEQRKDYQALEDKMRTIINEIKHHEDHPAYSRKIHTWDLRSRKTYETSSQLADTPIQQESVSRLDVNRPSIDSLRDLFEKCYTSKDKLDNAFVNASSNFLNTHRHLENLLKELGTARAQENTLKMQELESSFEKTYKSFYKSKDTMDKITREREIFTDDLRYKQHKDTEMHLAQKVDHFTASLSKEGQETIEKIKEDRYQEIEKKLDNIRDLKDEFKNNWEIVKETFTISQLENSFKTIEKIFEDIIDSRDDEISATLQETWLDKLKKQKAACKTLYEEFKNLMVFAGQSSVQEATEREPNIDGVYQREIEVNT